MIDRDKWREIWHMLGMHKLRTALTAFGVFWGIFLLVVLLGAGRGLQNGTEKTFGSDLRDSIWLSARQTSVPYKGLALDREVAFSLDDIDELRRRLPDALFVSAQTQLRGDWRGPPEVSHRNKNGSFQIYGVADDYFEIKKYQDYLQGRRLNRLDSAESAKVATIGTRVAETLFPGVADPVGEYIRIDSIPFKVVGVFYDDGREGRMSEYIYIPLRSLHSVFGTERGVETLVLAPRPGADGFRLEASAIELLKARHQIAPNDRRAIFSWNMGKETQAIANLFLAINILIWFVGLGTLIAGIMGVSNIMILSIKDRTTEIGIRKAVGATPGSVINMILSESILISGVSGYSGLVAGVAMLEGAGYLMRRFHIEAPYFDNPEIDIKVALVAVVLVAAIGAVAGLVPGLKAAHIKPVAAIREGGL
jgi:putative ABC transport system permease protein